MTILASLSSLHVDVIQDAVDSIVSLPSLLLWGLYGQILCRQVWLKLLKEHKNQSNLVLLLKLFDWSVLNLIEIQVKVFIRA